VEPNQLPHLSPFGPPEVVISNDEAQNLAVAALEALILCSRYQNRALAPVARHSHGLGQRQVLIAPDVSLKFGGGYLDHAVKPLLRNNLT
jgi:hypothetical protein